jgi:hypothetical protein
MPRLRADDTPDDRYLGGGVGERRRRDARRHGWTAEELIERVDRDRARGRHRLGWWFRLRGAGLRLETLALAEFGDHRLGVKATTAA